MFRMVRLAVVLLTLSALCRLTLTSVCSRAESRIARHILDELVLSSYKKVGLEAPPACVWSPRRDIYRVQEEHKVWVAEYQYDCSFCGKAFISENYLDRHFERKHSDQEYKADDKVCVSDYCHILRCDFLRPGANIGYWEKALCKERDLVPLRKECEAIVSQCVPKGEDASEELRDLLLKNVCSYLTCTTRWKYPEDWGRISSVSLLIIVLVSILAVLLLLLLCCLGAEDRPETATSKRWKPEVPQRVSRRRREPAIGGRKHHVM